MQQFIFEHHRILSIYQLKLTQSAALELKGFDLQVMSLASVTSAITRINIIKLIKWYTGEIRKYSPSVSDLRFVKILTISLA